MTLPFDRTWLVKRYLYGLDLTDDDGEDFPDAMFDQGLRVALEQVRKVLDVEVYLRSFTERHDYELNHWEMGAWLSSRRRPYHSTTALKLHYGTQEISGVPSSWIVESQPEAGSIQLVPVGAMQVSPVIMAGWVPGLMSPLGGQSRVLPGFYGWSYDAGMLYFRAGLPYDSAHAPSPTFRDGARVQVELSQVAPSGGTIFTVVGTSVQGVDFEVVTVAEGETKGLSAYDWTAITSITPATPPSVGTWDLAWNGIPADVQHLIGMIAGTHILNTAGDLIAGAGIAGKSISVDGLSQSVQTTSSATNAGYGARILQWAKEAKTLVPRIRSYYHGHKVGFA